jgi:hypothetical protein
MARPRKNPNDPKWNKCDRCGEVNPAEVHTCTPIKHQESIKNNELHDVNLMLQNVGSYEQVPTNDVKLILYAVSLAGVIAQCKPMSHEQAARNAMEYAEAALKIWG